MRAGGLCNRKIASANGLAGSRFANNPQPLAGFQIEADPICRSSPAVTNGIGDGEVLYLKSWVTHIRLPSRGLANSSNATEMMKRPTKRMIKTAMGGAHHHHMPRLKAAYSRAQ